MTDCQTTREWLLEVDPKELARLSPSAQPPQTETPEGATDTHADHLAECGDCRALADEILGAEAALRDGLDSLQPALGVEAALARARATHEVQDVDTAHGLRRRWRVAVPLAAAALGGLLLIGRPSPVSIADLDPATASAARALGLVGPGPVVRAGSDDRVAVLPTGNPNITVIWFME